MYDSYFDSDDDIDAEDAIRRAYALGVASVCSNPDDDAEYEHLRQASPDSYDESLLELAFEEGRAKALKLESKADDEEVWEILVESELGASGPEKTKRDPPGPTGLPDALTRSKRDAKNRLPESLELPSFLRK